jgi:hypothetical protein
MADRPDAVAPAEVAIPKLERALVVGGNPEYDGFACHLSMVHSVEALHRPNGRRPAS